MEEFISYNGKKLRKGYTTGTCATVATMAATHYLLTGQALEEVFIQVPAGSQLKIPVHSLEEDQAGVTACVIKDGGDDADATHGMEIKSTVSWQEGDKISIDGGVGIGRVTLEGLPRPIGQAAINPVPLAMIEKEARKLIGPDRGLKITIWAPQGQEIAKSTYNPRLGIVGGISILGTSGIVSPMSEEAWKQAISIEMEMVRRRSNRIILTPGNYGEDFLKDHTRISLDNAVQMSNFIGYVLKEVQRLAFDQVLLVGHLGKFIKLAGGIFSTHSKDADCRNEIMVANLALLGAPRSLLEAIDSCNTTEAQAELILQAGYEEVYQVLVNKMKDRAYRYIKYRHPHVSIEVISFLNRSDVVYASKPLTVLEEEWS